MPGTRQPLAVLDAKGKKHFTKAERAEREEAEVHAGTPKFVRPPAWLEEPFHKEFSETSRQLLDLKIFSKLDRDTLGQYLVARNLWLQATNSVTAAMQAGDHKLVQSWTQVQNIYFAQCRRCAADLGLTISSRCRLVIPKAPEEDEDAEAAGAMLRIFG